MLYYTPMYVSWLITETLKISLSVRHWTTDFWNTMQNKLHLLCFPKYFGNIIINITNLCMCPVARISIWGLFFFFFWKRTNYFSNYCHHSGRMNFHQDHKCFTVGQMSSLCMTLKWLVRTMAMQGLKRESLEQIPTCKKRGEQSELFAKMRWGPCILLFSLLPRHHKFAFSELFIILFNFSLLLSTLLHFLIPEKM